jgi:hypothetical protein
MASSYTSLLKFNQPALGDAGWGTSINNGFTAMAEQAMTGVVTKAVTVAGPNTLGSIANGVSSEARNQFIVLTGTLASPASLTVPAGATDNYKLYFVKNTASDAVTITAGGTGVVVPAGKSMILRVTGTDVEEAMTHAVSFSIGTLSLTNALAATSGGTGQSSYAIGDLLYANTTTTLAKLADVATGNVLRSGGVGVAPAWGKVDLTTDVTGTLPVANGGTGQTTANAALNALLPSQTSNNNKFLQTDGTNTSWATVDILGTIAAASAGAVGTYAMMIPSPNATFAVGDQTAGSNLRFGGTYTDGSGNTGPVYGGTPSGNWRAVGPTNGGYNFTISLWLRYV